MTNDKLLVAFNGIASKLNQMKSSGDPRPFYDLMSGGIIWTDEKPPFETDTQELGSLRMIWNYRTSIFRNRPRKEYEEFWTAARQIAPQWPGFLPERQVATPELLDLILKSDSEDPLGSE